MPPSEDPSFALYILDMDSNSTMLQLVGDDIVCTHLDADRGIWFIWGGEDASPGVPCEPVSLRGGKRLTLDAGVLSGPGKSFASITDQANSPPSSMALQYCDNLQLALFGPEPVAFHDQEKSIDSMRLKVPSFVTMTAASSTYEQLSLWLDYCDLNPPQVQLRDSDLIVPPHDLSTVESICSVRRVLGLEAYTSGFYSFTSDDIFACLEEVMNVMEVVRLRRIDALSMEVGMDKSSQQSHGAIVYLSAFGLPPFRGTKHSDEFLKDTTDDYLRVIRSFYASDVRHLIVGSSSFRALPIDNVDDYEAIDVLSDMIANDKDLDSHSSDLSSVIQRVSTLLAIPSRREGAFRRLQHRLIEENYLKEFEPLHSPSAVLATKQLFLTIVNSYIESPRIHSAAIHRTTPKDIEISGSHVLRLVDAGSINILDALMFRLLGGSAGGYQTAINLFPLAPSFLLSSYFKSVSPSDFIHISGALSRGECMPGSLKQSDPTIDILMTYVLIFVDRDDLPETQLYVQTWKRREILRSNLYIRYYTLQTPHRDNYTNADPKLDFVGKHLRFSLLSAKQVLLDTAGKLDVVIVLNGIEAVRAFIAPTQDAASDTGIMPFPFEVNPSPKVRLSSPLVFSSRAPSSQSGGIFDQRLRSECMVLCRVAFHSDPCPCSDAPLIDSRGFASKSIAPSL
jgi:hypothetical protein